MGWMDAVSGQIWFNLTGPLVTPVLIMQQEVKGGCEGTWGWEEKWPECCWEATMDSCQGEIINGTH
jgi:hypothetical protein